MKLQELIDLIAEDWPFHPENYPTLSMDGSQNQQLLFKIQHILHHQGKALGSLSGIIEVCEHNSAEVLDLDQIKTLVEKFLRNTLRLAEIAGMSANDSFLRCKPTPRPFSDRSYG
jgi:hypothetical protein